MTSLFKSKASKEFTTLTIKAIPTINRDTAKSIYNSIKNKTNKEWTSIELALDCLQRKLNLNVQISVYKNFMKNKKKNKARAIKSAQSHLSKLLNNSDTTQLFQELENGCNLSKGSLMNTEIPTYKMPRSPLHRSRKRAYTETNSKTFFKTNNNRHYSGNKYRYRKMRSDTLPDDIYIKPSNINTKEQLNFYLERALSNSTWNEKDADILCKTAINIQCNLITVHSVWVKKCYQLLHTYTVQKYKNDLKLYKKSNRRGYKKIDNFRIYEDENDIKSETKICVAVGYPFGQTSTFAKVAEVTQAVMDGAKRVSLMLCGGKIIDNDWKYITNEIINVMEVLKNTDIDLDIAFPESAQITNDIKSNWNHRIMDEIINSVFKTQGNEEKEGVKYNEIYRDKSSVSDSSSTDEEEESKKSHSGEKRLSIELLKKHNSEFEDSSDNEPEPQEYYNESEDNISSFWESESKENAIKLEHNNNTDGSQLMDDDMDDMGIIMEDFGDSSTLSTSKSNSYSSPEKYMKVMITDSVTDVTPEPEYEPGSPLHIQQKKKKKHKNKKRKTKYKRDKHKLNENKARKSVKKNLKNKGRKYKPKKCLKTVRKKKKRRDTC